LLLICFLYELITLTAYLSESLLPANESTKPDNVRYINFIITVLISTASPKFALATGVCIS
jgi:hypothetical protein